MTQNFKLFTIIGLHSHTEAEIAAMADTFRLYTDLTSTFLDNLWGHIQSYADAFVVDICGALKFSEASKDFWKILFCDAYPCVFHLND